MASTTDESLLREFIRNAVQAAATVEVIPADPLALANALSTQTADDGDVLLAEPSDLDPSLFAKFKTNPNVINAPDKEQLKTTRTGVTDAFCGVASTGSVCVSVGAQVNAVVGMLTRKHVVVLAASSIVPRPRDVLSDRYLNGEGLRRSFSYVTGPSATADMGPLVRGVHGPGTLHIIVLE